MPRRTPLARIAALLFLALGVGVVLVLGIGAGHASAQPRLPGPELVVHALARWEALRPGRGSLLHDGRDLALQQTGGRWTEAVIMPVPAVSPSGPFPGPADSYLTLMARWEARRTAPRREAAIEAWAATLRTDQDVSRAAFVVALTDLWLQAALHRAEATHLAGDHALLASTLEAWTVGAGRGFLDRTEEAELRAELGRLEAERLRCLTDEADLLTLLQADLGTLPEVPGVFPYELGLSADQVLALDDPWARLLARMDRDPAFRARAARADLLQAEAARLAASRPAVVGWGTEVHQLWGGIFQAGLLVEVTLPIARRHRADAAQVEAEGLSLRLEAEAEQVRRRAHLEAERSRWRLRMEEVQQLEEALLGALRSRVEAWESRAGAQRGDTRALVAALRDLHEAEHVLLLQYLEALRTWARAAVMADTLDALQAREEAP
jgi:hypothetical protein